MADPQDKAEITHGVRSVDERGGERAATVRRPWLSIWFNCCAAYARIYRNAAGTMYEGRCPKCGGYVRALVGPDGTTKRIFETL